MKRTLLKMRNTTAKEADSSIAEANALSVEEAEAILSGLASTYSNLKIEASGTWHHFVERSNQSPVPEGQLPNLEAKYQALLEQLPAVVFMAYLDRGIGEAYVSPQIEATLGFTQAEWLEDPVMWYQRIHPDDKARWSLEASEMFLTGKPLRSAYRVMARDGHAVWFHCEAKMILHPDGHPWFIQGVAFDITDLKQTEEELQGERNVVSAILDTVGALVVVLDREGRVVRFNRACEQMTGHSFEQVRGQCLWDLFVVPEEKRSTLRLCSRSFASIPHGRSTKALGWPATAVTEPSPGQQRCCQPPNKRPRTSLPRGLTSPIKRRRKRNSGDCWKQHRTQSWSSTRRGRLFW